MEDVGLIWNPKKCAVAQFKRGVRVPESTGLLMSDGNVKIPTLEDGLSSRDSIQSICSASNVLLHVDTALANNRTETG